MDKLMAHIYEPPPSLLDADPELPPQLTRPLACRSLWLTRSGSVARRVPGMAGVT